MRVSLPRVGLSLADGFLTTCIAGLLTQALGGPAEGLGLLPLLAWSFANGIAVIPLVAVALGTRVGLVEIIAGPPAVVLLTCPLVLLGLSPLLFVLPGPILAFSSVSLLAVLLHGDRDTDPLAGALRRWALAAMIALVAAPMLGLAIVPRQIGVAAPAPGVAASDDYQPMDPADRH